MGCVIGAKYNMKATLIRISTGVEHNDEPGWHYEWKQDPDSGAMVQVEVEDDISTPDVDESIDGLVDFEAQIRGVIDGGIRVAGSTETFDKIYTAVEWVKMAFPPNFTITRRDQVTNIKESKSGKIIFVEEEGRGGPTVFNVMGVTPIMDPFGQHVENFTLLQRAEING